MPVDRKVTYQLAEALLQAIKDADPAALLTYGVTPAIHEEIIEELDSSGENIAALTLAPYEVAFTPDRTGRIPVDSYQTNGASPQTIVACQLWCGGSKTDLTLTADQVEKPNQVESQDGASLVFRLLETQ
ncbi:hypothetical protein FXN63_22730 [Pigmentiphaga aceris]|uniref:Uncharacterized protein n=1 Tax=Pigmentiphaga aceris TaxID=1940612 RepID=A0A5C0B6R5_9BURK|nr:hypothetical protein [Pigmentiphaga aceris]QEI08337.1 hypothetical protein FXN63_22730 [Pigmentiphaga aceris]